MNILFAAAECAPVAKVGGLGDVVGSLPKALLELGADARIILPRYKIIGPEFLQNKITMLEVPFGGKNYHVDVYQTKLPDSEVVLYLLDESQMFGSGGVYEQSNAAPGGEGEVAKFLFYNRCIISFLEKELWTPHVLHVHDWHAAYLARLVRELDWELPTLLTIHNLAMQGQASGKVLQLVEREVDEKQMYNLLKIGIENASRVNTVSPSYASEILTPEFGEGLDQLLKNRGDVFGIINGIDETVWNETSDPFITNHYSSFSAGLKMENKAVLQQKLGLAVNPEIPLAGIVSRLTEQKGLDLFLEISDKLAELPLQIIVVGVGDPKIENLFTNLAQKHPEKFCYIKKFDERLAHQVYAASDIFVMPSRFEPCGLGQMIAMHYGSIPLVVAVGGLKDSVQPLDDNGNNVETATGFYVERGSGSGLLQTITQAVFLYQNDPFTWRLLVRNSMQSDFSWTGSAQKYLDAYKQLKIIAHS